MDFYKYLVTSLQEQMRVLRLKPLKYYMGLEINGVEEVEA